MSALRAVQDYFTPQRPADPRPALTVLTGRSKRDRLSVVRAPLRARSAVPFAMLCAAILGAALVLVLVLNTRMVNGSYALAGLQREAARAAQDVQMLHEQVRTAQAGLPSQAAAIGMAPAEQPIPLDVSGVVVLTAEELGEVAQANTAGQGGE